MINYTLVLYLRVLRLENNQNAIDIPPEECYLDYEEPVLTSGPRNQPSAAHFLYF